MFRARPSGWARVVRRLRSAGDAGAAAAGALAATLAAAALIYWVL